MLWKGNIVASPCSVSFSSSIIQPFASLHAAGGHTRGNSSQSTACGIDGQPSRSKTPGQIHDVPCISVADSIADLYLTRIPVVCYLRLRHIQVFLRTAHPPMLPLDILGKGTLLLGHPRRQLPRRANKFACGISSFGCRLPDTDPTLPTTVESILETLVNPNCELHRYSVLY